MFIQTYENRKHLEDVMRARLAKEGFTTRTPDQQLLIAKMLGPRKNREINSTSGAAWYGDEAI